MTMSDRIAVMNKGRSAGGGGAGFVVATNGYADFRLTQLAAASASPLVLVVEGRGKSVALGVRPKFRMIEPSKDVPAGLNRVPGVVGHAAVGEQVVLAWSPDHCFVVDETGDPAPEPVDLDALEAVAASPTPVCVCAGRWVCVWTTCMLPRL